MKRDPYLPSPEVCDWLLSQEWDGPLHHFSSTTNGTCTIYGAHVAIATLGTDNVADLVLHEEALEALREDAKARAGKEAG